MKLLFAVKTGLVVALATWCCLGCSSDENQDPAGEIADRVDQSANVRGNWVGSTSEGQTVAFALQQSLLTVTGVGKVGELEGSINGAVDGKTFGATLSSDPMRIIKCGVQFEEVMDGTIRDLTGGILSSFRAVRQ